MTTPQVPPSWNTIAKAVELHKAGKRGQAYKMIAGMRIKKALTREQLKTLGIAGEMLTSSGPSLYSQMGFKLDVVTQEAEAIFAEAFLKDNNGNSQACNNPDS